MSLVKWGRFWTFMGLLWRLLIPEIYCILGSTKFFTLPETNIAMENPPFWWYLPGKIGIFYGYVSLPEGNRFQLMFFQCNISIFM